MNAETPLVGDYRKELSSVLEEMLENCTQCKRCVRDCQFLRRYGDPHELAERFRDNVLPVDVVLSCSLCRLCKAVCPEGLDPYRMLWLMRCDVTEQGQVDLGRYRALLTYERLGLSGSLSLFRLPEGCKTVFFPGCALPGTRPEQFKKLLVELQGCVPGLGVILSCCGKPSHDLGRVSYFETVFRDLLGRLRQEGIETILTACPSCHQVFEQYGNGLQVKTVYEILGDGWTPTKNAPGSQVRIHDPCNARFNISAQDSIRTILAKMGIGHEEMKHHRAKTFCCGEGGTVFRVDPELAGNWSIRRSEEAEGAHLVTYCAGCTHFLGAHSDVSHIVDFLLDPQAACGGSSPVSRSPLTYVNRWLLKRFIKGVVSRS